MIDVEQQVNAARRQVGTRTIEAGEVRTVTVARTYPAEVADLWDACTNPERIPRWFLPVTGDLRLHGRYQLEGNASGTIEACDPPHGFRVTWEFGGMTSWLEVRLVPEGPERTRLELEHLAPEDEHWEQFGPGAAGVGWELALMGLAQHLSSNQALDPAEAAAWAVSPEGQRFMVLSSQHWGKAEEAAGADPAAARAAAERTAAFYTGASEVSPGS